MKDIIQNMIYGWHQGKGSKFLRQKKYKKALEHYLIALKYATDFGDNEMIAIEMEAVARLHFYLEEYKQALDYAEKSYKIIKEYKDTAPVYNEYNKRVVDLLKKIHLKMKGESEE